MIDQKTIVGIIPARGGSKRLPRKNVKMLAGKPLIAWTIEAATHSRYLDQVMVSTDDHEIADVARALNAAVPFLRPQELATDTSTAFDAVKHVLDHYKNVLGREFDYVMLLQPTSPLRESGDVDGALELMHSAGADAVISVCEAEHSPLWTNSLPPDFSMSGFLREDLLNKQSQELEKYYRLNGAIYVCDTKRLLEEKTFYIKDKVFAYVMPQERSVDVDTLLDFRLCELLLSESRS